MRSSLKGTDELMREDFRSHGDHNCNRCHCSADASSDCALAFDWQEAKIGGQKHQVKASAAARQCDTEGHRLELGRY